LEKRGGENAQANARRARFRLGGGNLKTIPFWKASASCLSWHFHTAKEPKAQDETVSGTKGLTSLLEKQVKGKKRGGGRDPSDLLPKETGKNHEQSGQKLSVKNIEAPQGVPSIYRGTCEGGETLVIAAHHTTFPGRKKSTRA